MTEPMRCTHVRMRDVHSMRQRYVMKSCHENVSKSGALYVDNQHIHYRFHHTHTHTHTYIRSDTKENKPVLMSSQLESNDEEHKTQCSFECIQHSKGLFSKFKKNVLKLLRSAKLRSGQSKAEAKSCDGKCCV